MPSFKFYQYFSILLFSIHFFIIGSVFVNPNPFMSYQPPYIESNEYSYSDFYADSIEVPANDSPTAHKSEYTLTFERIQASLPIKITSCLSGLTYGTFVGGGLSPNSAAIFFSIKSISSGGFAIEVFIQHVSRLAIAKCRYLAINEVEVGLFYFYEGSFNAFQSLSCCTPISTTIPHSCPSSYTEYNIFFVVRGINIYKTINMVNLSYSTWLAIDSSGCLISLTGNYVYLSSVSYTLIYYKKSLEYNYVGSSIWHTKIVELENDNCYQGSFGYGGCIVYNSATHVPSFQILTNNYFLGIRHFRCYNSISYLININGNTLDAYLTTNHQLDVDGILFYGYKCPDGFYMSPTAKNCVKCSSKCFTCNATQCFQCAPNYAIDTKNLASCQLQLPLPISFQACSFIEEYNGQIKCRFCDENKHFQIDTQITGCKCADGYIFNPLTQICIDNCGDGRVFDDQCDDGGILSNDGCSDKCKIEEGFVCDNSVTPTFCKSKQDLTYSIGEILKHESEEGKGILILKPLNKLLPLKIFENNFYSHGDVLTHLVLITEEGPPEKTIPLNFKLISVENNLIKLVFDYDFTVENLNARIFLNYSQTRYSQKIQTITFKLKGSNAALKFSPYQNQYKIVSSSILVTVILSMLGLLAGLFVPKFIGLQTIVTMQLIYFSQLLIVEYEKWPVGFAQFVNMKAATGYNEILDLIEYTPLNNLDKKYHQLIIHKTVVENLNVNFVVLVVFAVAFYGSTILRNVKEISILQQIQQMKTEKNALKPSITYRSYHQVNKVNEVLYWMTTQLCFWSILPLMSAIGGEFLIGKKFVTLVKNNQMSEVLLNLRGVQFFFLFVVTLSVGLNLFNNIFLSIQTVRKIEERPEQILYKKMLFIYLFVMGGLIFFWNNTRIQTLPISLLCLIIHTAYTIALPTIKPYKQSLRIHAVALYLNQALYLLFLVILNIINFIDSIDQFILLCLGYFISGTGWVLILLIVFRLYYEIRYGQALEKKIQEQRRNEKEDKKRKKEEKLKNKIAQLQLQAKLKLTQAQQARNLNKYLIQTQAKEQQKRDLLQWLESRNWDQESKEKYYYKEFHEKPLEWIKKNDEEDYKKKLDENKALKQVQKIKIKATKQNPDYIELTTRLRKVFEQKKKKKSHGQHQ